MTTMSKTATENIMASALRGMEEIAQAELSARLEEAEKGRDAAEMNAHDLARKLDALAANNTCLAGDNMRLATANSKVAKAMKAAEKGRDNAEETALALSGKVGTLRGMLDKTLDKLAEANRRIHAEGASYAESRAEARRLLDAERQTTQQLQHILDEERSEYDRVRRDAIKDANRYEDTAKAMREAHDRVETLTFENARMSTALVEMAIYLAGAIKEGSS